MQYVDFRKESGQLVITPTPEGREALAEARADGVNVDADDFTFDLIEHQLCNGWEQIQPEECGALTDGLLLTDDCVRDDGGKITNLGRVYWHTQYQVESVVGELLRRGRCILTGCD